MPKHLVFRSWVEIRRDPNTHKLVRTTMSAADEFESLAMAAAHYNRARDFRWVGPGQEEPDVTASPEVVKLAEKEEPVARVPMPAEVRAALARFTKQVSPESEEYPI